MLASGWVCVFVAAVYADSEIKLYKKVGDEAVLKLDAPWPGAISSILWKEGPNIAMQWDGIVTDAYRQFKERGSLNTTTGEMTITGLTRGDSGLYTPEINSILSPATRLFVISPVPEPSVSKSCEDESSCVLTCEGNTTDAEPVTYNWESPEAGSAKERRITKADSSSISEFMCELKNPISRESSQHIPNPFFQTTDKTEPGNMNIAAGVTVFIILVTAVLIVIIIHKCKSGEWFFQKDSMPWESGFWKRSDRQERNAADTNGTPTREAEAADGDTNETLMKEEARQR
uniref:uncharacterized protein LOC124055372 n=1 Tax=Scatophagus argus TaxID=75038 RepID=UPI001ED80C2E|nr:uncharacterized protein LOC124055372 [Scatophagus argus]